MNVLRPSAMVLGALAAGLAFAGGRTTTVISEQSIPEHWSYAPDLPHFVPGYPSTAADKSRDVCVTIGYQVDIQGRTSNFTELNSWSSATPDATPGADEIEPYVQIAAAVVSRWRFVPVGKAHAVYTSASFAFDGSKAVGQPEILAHCRIGDLQDFVAQLQSQSQKTGNLDLARLRARRDAEEQARRPTNAPQGGY